jgi:imidazolonepropionase-like amidohydrolase
MPTVLKAAAVLDVDNGRVIPGGYVRVGGGKIKSWGHRVDLSSLSPDTAVLSFPQQTLLPGLINSHAHLCVPSGGQPFYMEQSDEMALLTAVRNMQTEQAAGITTVRDCGDQNGVLFALRRAVQREILDGPRMVLCGPPLTVSGGHAHFLGGIADGPAEIARTVRRRVADGADFIKLIGTGGGTPGTRPAQASYSRDELASAVAEAHRLEVPVTVHCRGIPGIVNAIEAGVDQIEHACFELPDGTLGFDRKLAGRMAQAGIGVTPTIQLYRDALAHLQKKAVTGDLDETERQYLKILPGVIESKLQALRGFFETGVHVVAGNDAGLPYTGFGCLWQELDVMMSAGMTAMQAIAAATESAARMLGLEDQIGSIQPGKQADLLIVDGNPIEDIAALSRVRLVMQAGRIVFKKTDRCERQLP